MNMAQKMIHFFKWLFGVLLASGVLFSMAWAVLAVWFRGPVLDPLRWGQCGVVALVGLTGFVMLFSKRRALGLVICAAVFGLVVLWWNTLTPPANRDWSPEVARQSYGSVTGDILTVNDMRDFTWRSKEDYDARWISRDYDLTQLETTDVFLSYWGAEYMAHLIVSFGFADGEQLAWSVEVRREKGGGFSPIADMFKANTLAILAATERDVVGLRTNIRGEDVQLYRLKVRPVAARNILEAFTADASDLRDNPRWYHSLFTNCTTVVTRIMDGVGAGQPWDWRVIANGYLPEFAYELGAVNTAIPLDELRERGRVAERAKEHGLTDGFSAAIRVGVPSP